MHAKLLQALILPALACAALLPLRTADAATVTIMTQNMNEGTNYQALATAQTPLQFVTAVTQTYQQIQATNPAARGAAIAQEIADHRPDLVALQEASAVRTGTGGPATTVMSDLLTAVTTNLAALGQHYTPVVVAPEFDAQAPSTLGFNVRLTTRDVILARTDLPGSQLVVGNPQAQTFGAQLVVPTPAGPVTFTRGWASVDATVDGQTFRFVTTHLDTGEVSPLLQLAQAQQLLAGAGATSLPVLYAGDFNSDASNPLGPTYPTWQFLTSSGLRDAWLLAHPADAGLTCCHPSDPLNPDPTLQQRIDLALLTGPFTVDDAQRVGATAADFAQFGFWPSDHAGLLLVVDLPEPGSLVLLSAAAICAALSRLVRRRDSGIR